jgi:hypothetical protein
VGEPEAGYLGQVVLDIPCYGTGEYERNDA